MSSEQQQMMKAVEQSTYKQNQQKNTFNQTQNQKKQESLIETENPKRQEPEKHPDTTLVATPKENQNQQVQGVSQISQNHKKLLEQWLCGEDEKQIQDQYISQLRQQQKENQKVNQNLQKNIQPPQSQIQDGQIQNNVIKNNLQQDIPEKNNQIHYQTQQMPQKDIQKTENKQQLSQLNIRESDQEKRQVFIHQQNIQREVQAQNQSKKQMLEENRVENNLEKLSFDNSVIQTQQKEQKKIQSKAIEEEEQINLSKSVQDKQEIDKQSILNRQDSISNVAINHQVQNSSLKTSQNKNPELIQPFQQQKASEQIKNATETLKNSLISSSIQCQNPLKQQNKGKENGKIHGSNHFSQNIVCQSSTISPTQGVKFNQPNRYNAYVQGLIASQNLPNDEPTHAELQELYQTLGKEFPECSPKQIILLLYNNLIRIPRQELLSQQAQTFDQKLLFDGDNYLKSLKTQQQLDLFALRRKMVYVYTTKGYGVKVYHEYMLKKNPNEEIMDKDKFKAHFVNIYKIVIKKVEDFLSKVCDRQLSPMNRQEFHKTLGDVINCRKHFSPQFCEVYFRLLKSIFDLKSERVPNEKQVIFFYRQVMAKGRDQKIVLYKRFKEQVQEQDTDIWSEQFQTYFLKLYIKHRSITQAKNAIIQNYPQYAEFLQQSKLKSKIENAIRQATRWVQIENQNSGNKIAFCPRDIDRRFIMKTPELEESRIKLLKVYVKKVKDAEILSQVVALVKKQLENKYIKENIPTECLKDQFWRSEFEGNRKLEESLLTQMIRNQIKQKTKFQLTTVMNG